MWKKSGRKAWINGLTNSFTLKKLMMARWNLSELQADARRRLAVRRRAASASALEQAQHALASGDLSRCERLCEQADARDLDPGLRPHLEQVRREVGRFYVTTALINMGFGSAVGCAMMMCGMPRLAASVRVNGM